jgi:hypothetical protein
MVMSEPLRLVLHGLDGVSSRLREEIVYIIRQEFEPLVNDAGRTLRLIVGSAHGDLNIHFDTESPPGRVCHNTILGECGTGSVFVEAHRNLRVCDARDPHTGQQDTRRFLTHDWLLGRALANCALHELGHFIANLDHSADRSNYMVTGSIPVEERTIRSQRHDWAGQKSFTPAQRIQLVAQIRTGVWLGDFTVEYQ